MTQKVMPKPRYPLDLARQEAYVIESNVNKSRTLTLISKLESFAGSHDNINAATYIEFMSYLLDSKKATPGYVMRVARYLYTNSVLRNAYGIPFFAGGYVILSKLIDRTLAWELLARIENPSVQAWLALMISGFRHYKNAHKVSVDGYSTSTGVARFRDHAIKVHGTGKMYLDAQYNRAIGRGLSGSDPLFFIDLPSGKYRRITMTDITLECKRVKVKTGYDLLEYALVAGRTQGYEADKHIKLRRM